MKLLKALISEISEKHVSVLIDKFQKEKPGLSPVVIRAYIERFEQIKNSPNVVEKDIFKLSWKDLEETADRNRKRDIKAGKVEPDKIDGNLIYNKNDIRVYQAPTRDACVKYGNGYTFCISARGDDSMYSSYRHDENGTPFFVFRDNIPKDDPDHLLVVIHYLNEEGDNYKYSVTNANNDGEDYFESDMELVSTYPELRPIVDAEIFGHIPVEDKEDKEHTVKVIYDMFSNELLRKINSSIEDYSGTDINPVMIANRDGILSGKKEVFRATLKTSTNQFVLRSVTDKGTSISDIKEYAYKVFGGDENGIEDDFDNYISKDEAIGVMYVVYLTNEIIEIFKSPQINKLVDEHNKITRLRDSDLNKISLGLDDLELPKYKLPKL